MSKSLVHYENLRRIFLAGVRSVQAEGLFQNGKFIQQNRMENLFSGDKHCYHLIGFGKAVLGMAVQIEKLLGKRLKSGILSIPVGSGKIFKDSESKQLKADTVIQVFEGAKNNFPDNGSLETAKKIQKLAQNLQKKDILIVLISGGGSALLSLPKFGITLDEKLDVIRELVKQGATINELNIVRISLSDIKGGKLSKAAKNAYKIISFVLSDIVGDPLNLIASGPTIQFHSENDMTSIDILLKYKIWLNLSARIKECIDVHPDNDPILINNFIYMIGNNTIACEACLSEANLLGYAPYVLSTKIEGNIESVENLYVDLIKNIKLYKTGTLKCDEFLKILPFPQESTDNFLKILAKSIEERKSLCLILGGETTVKIRGKGIGGRNQELALRIALRCYKDNHLHDIVFLSAGTDGIDGPDSNAAGALGVKDVVQEFLKTSNIQNLENFLRNNDSYSFYNLLSNGKFHIITGHTGTNVMDLHLIVIPF